MRDDGSERLRLLRWLRREVRLFCLRLRRTFSTKKGSESGGCGGGAWGEKEGGRGR